MWSRAIASGLVAGDLLDLDAALGREHAEVQLGRPVEGEAGVVLLGDVRGVLDPQPVHDVALDVHARGWPRRAGAASSASSASLMPPALPRPPTFTCALTTTG